MIGTQVKDKFGHEGKVTGFCFVGDFPRFEGDTEPWISAEYIGPPETFDAVEIKCSDGTVAVTRFEDLI